MTQKPFTVFGVNVGLSVVTAWVVLALLIAALVLINLLVVRRMKMQPGKFQNVLEFAIGGLDGWCKGKVGEAGAFVAPITATLMLYVFSTTVVELFGFSPATEDINCTFALGLCTFVMVNVTGLKFRGVKGRIKGLCTPTPIVAPIRIVTDLIAPCSIAIRLFANIMVGGIIMQLIYAVAPIIVPAIVASYFNVLHTGIQSFVIGLLSLVYVSEAIE
ncbi:MAG: FoF1 ATP synthase subunit a [Clostridia bacterium]